MGQANEFLPEPCIRNCLSPSNLYIRQGPSYRENDTEGLFLLIVLSKIRIQRRWGKETASRPAQMRKSNKEADHKTQTRTAALSLFRTAKWEIAKQEAAVNGQDEQATPTV